MKVKALILCLVLVPAVLAQVESGTTQEEEGLFDAVFGDLYNKVVDYFKSNVDTESIRQNAEARMNKGLELITQGWAVIDEALDEYSIDVPDMQPIEVIKANLTTKYNQFRDTTQEHFQLFKDMLNDEFSLFNDEPEEQEEQEPESEPESEAESESAWWNFF